MVAPFLAGTGPDLSAHPERPLRLVAYRPDSQAGGANRSQAAHVRDQLLGMVDRFRGSAASDVDASFLVRVASRTPYTFTIRGGHCVVMAGAGPHPDVEIACDVATFEAFASGLLDPILAFQAGQFQVRGDLNLAIRLQTMFEPAQRGARPLVTRHTMAGGVRIESLVQGTGTPVLLLHGLGASKVSFLPTLEDLSHDHEVHALDLPGFGKSGKPLPRGRRYTPQWFANCVRDYLSANHLGAAHLVGNSMGGRIALETALRHPHLVRSITGLGPAVGFDGWQPASRLVGRVHAQWLAASPVVVPTTLLRQGIASLFHDPTRLPADNLDAAAFEVQQCLKDRRYRMATLAAGRHLAAETTWGRNGYWTRLADLQRPSLWIWGKSDVLVPSRYAARVKRVLPEAQVTVWPDCGHVPQFELPERTHTRLREFLVGVN